MDIKETGTYLNESKQQYEAWAVNQVTGEKMLLGCWSAHLPENIRKKYEDAVWKSFVFR